MENTNPCSFPDWSLLATPERRSSDWLIDDMAPEAKPHLPVRVLLSILDPGLRRMLAIGLRQDGHDVCESDDLVSPQACLKYALADIVVCGASSASARNSKPQELIVISGTHYSRRTLIRDPRDLNRLLYLVREHREATWEVS